MRTLVEVHVVKINRIIRNVVEILRSQMQQRFLQELRAANPVFSRREGMHPGDYTSNFIMIIDFLHEVRDALSRRHNALANHFIRQLAAGIELFRHIFHIAGNFF